MDLTFTLKSPNADYLQFKFSNVGTYTTTDGSMAYGQTCYFSKDTTNFFKYTLIAATNGFRIMYIGTSLKGSDVTAANTRYAGSCFYL